MPVFGRTSWFALAGAALMVAGVAIPASDAHDALLAATVPATGPSLPQTLAGDAMLAIATLPYQIDIDAEAATPAKASADTDASDASAATAEGAAMDPELECMAKVVRHEAANQPREGQLAVAQLIMNRVRSGRFPSTICGVVNQPGQFFQTASYKPSTKDKAWKTAVEVSREARTGESDDLVNGAIFYNAAYQPSAFMRSRTRVTQLGDHIFYR